MDEPLEEELFTLVLLPLLVPIEILSYVSRLISLSVRLFANMMAGHVMLEVFAGFVVMLGVAGGIFFVPAALSLSALTAASASPFHSERSQWFR